MTSISVPRPRLRSALPAFLGVTVLAVPAGIGSAAAEPMPVRTVQREDPFVVSGTECTVQSRQTYYSDGTVRLSTAGVEGEPGSGEACVHGVQEARVRYSYVDEDGDVQSGQAASPLVINVIVPLSEGTDLQSFHGLDYGSGWRTPDYRLPK